MSCADRRLTTLAGGIALLLSVQAFAGERKEGMQVGATIAPACRASVQSAAESAVSEVRSRALSVACPRQTAFQVMMDSRAIGYPPPGLTTTPFMTQGVQPEILHLAAPAPEAGGVQVQRITIEY